MFAAFSRLLRKPPPETRWVDAAWLRAQLGAAQPPLVLDVRGPDEFDGPLGHIESARNIPLAELGGRTAELAAANRPVVCVCLTDKRSAAAAAQLAAAGVGEVAVLRGGMKTWREGA
jgi:rhodanese-related sulfurtransferase